MSSLDINFTENLQVYVQSVKICDKITHYDITVELRNFSWTVSHRYSEFADLHELLVEYHGLARDLLPPKKIIGNKDPVFVEKRRKDLELYLQTVVGFMSAVMPEELAEFLDLKYYESNYLLQDLARFYFRDGDNFLKLNAPAVFNPLQLMTISKRMQNACPFLLPPHKNNDFANIVDFCSNVKKLIVEGSWNTFRSSNIVLNDLPYALNVFKCVEELELRKASVSRIEQLGPIRKKVKRLEVRECGVTELCSILNCDYLHCDVEYTGDDHIWSSLEEFDARSNEIQTIDQSVTLAPQLTTLNLCCNRLTSIGTLLTKLPQLTNMNLSNNLLQQLNNLHTKFGNIKTLDLSQNNLSHLDGFSKLYSVIHLNLSSNNICELSQVEKICNLPCLEELLLTGNPVATIIDYRTKVLELFGKRACEVCLDNEKTTQKELDKVAVLQALKSAREGQVPELSVSQPVPFLTLPFLSQRADLGTIAKE